MRPDFVVIGAMKAATSTLHQQLAHQPGIFMSIPKEPCFFSDDDVYAKGEQWYRGLFDDASPGELCGESSTHYTKLPDHPHTIDRMRELLSDDVRFIFVMRDPVDRLISHYIHLWTEGEVNGSIDEAVDSHPQLVDYGRYAYQLAPYLETFGHERVLPLFFARLRSHPQTVLDEVCRFIGYDGQPKWKVDDDVANASLERLRTSRLRDTVRDLRVFPVVRRVIPQRVVDGYHRRLRMTERPTLGAGVAARLETVFDEDLAVLGEWLGMPLRCADFDAVTEDRRATWALGSDRAQL